MKTINVLMLLIIKMMKKTTKLTSSQSNPLNNKSHLDFEVAFTIIAVELHALR